MSGETDQDNDTAENNYKRNSLTNSKQFLQKTKKQENCHGTYSLKNKRSNKKSLITDLSPLFMSVPLHMSVSLLLHMSVSSLFLPSPNDDDNDHSSPHLPVQKTLTLRAGVRGPWPFIGWRIARFVQK